MSATDLAHDVDDYDYDDDDDDDDNDDDDDDDDNDDDDDDDDDDSCTFHKKSVRFSFFSSEIVFFSFF